jgi:hypothetical protein
MGGCCSDCEDGTKFTSPPGSENDRLQHLVDLRKQGKMITKSNTTTNPEHVNIELDFGEWVYNYVLTREKPTITTQFSGGQYIFLAHYADDGKIFCDFCYTPPKMPSMIKIENWQDGARYFSAPVPFVFPIQSWTGVRLGSFPQSIKVTLGYAIEQIDGPPFTISTMKLSGGLLANQQVPPEAKPIVNGNDPLVVTTQKKAGILDIVQGS